MIKVVKNPIGQMMMTMDLEKIQLIKEEVQYLANDS